MTIIHATCATAAATAAKVVVTTLGNYVPQDDDDLIVVYTLGNSANAATLDVDGSGAGNVRLNNANATGTSGGAHYLVAGASCRYWRDGTYWQMYGSQDPVDNNDNTVAVINHYRYVTSSLKVSPDSCETATAVYHPFVGITPDGYIEKVTMTTSATAAGARVFTTLPLSLIDPIYTIPATTTAWTKGAAHANNIYDSLNVGVANWKQAVGQYYDKDGALVANSVTATLLQCPLYVGGIPQADGIFFVPTEYSVTLRDPTLVYKRIGWFSTAGNFSLTISQPVYRFDGADWTESPDGAPVFARVDAIPETGVPGIYYYTAV
jgi:hypothetical protein